MKALLLLLLFVPVTVAAQERYAVAQVPSRATARTYKILVEPNVLVTHDPASRFFEPFIAADPQNPQRLVVGATGRSGRLGEKSRAFWSADGGKTWNESALPEHRRGGDPYVAFGDRGAAYFSTLSYVSDWDNQIRALDVYRSENWGESWEEPVRLAVGHSVDYEKVAVDLSARTSADRVYVVAKGPGGTLEGSLLFRSDDGARTFGPPTVVHPDPVHVSSLVLQRDGAIVLPYYNENLSDPQDPARTHIVVVKSTDHGITFSRPMPVAAPDKTCLQGEGPARVPAPISFAKFLAADRSNSAYAGRLYAVWIGCHLGRPRIIFVWSVDGGKSWSKPRLVDSQAPDSAAQFLPAIEVNNQGVVGISWLDTRHSSGGNGFDAYFAASVDGGVSYIPAVRVSSESSVPSSAGNRTLDLRELRRAENGITGFLNSAYDFRGEGGDYLGLAGDAEGGFHYVWTDSRTGSMRIWTSRIRVVPFAAGGATRSTAGLATAATDKLMLEFDHLAYDAETKEHVLWARLRNSSADSVCRPIGLEFKAWEYKQVELTNADNGKSGEGATFDYTPALRDLDRLPPYGVTEPLAWRAKGPALDFGGSTVEFSAKITAGSCER